MSKKVFKKFNKAFFTVINASNMARSKDARFAYATKVGKFRPPFWTNLKTRLCIREALKDVGFSVLGIKYEQPRGAYNAVLQVEYKEKTMSVDIVVNTLSKGVQIIYVHHPEQAYEIQDLKPYITRYDAGGKYYEGPIEEEEYDDEDDGLDL